MHPLLPKGILKIMKRLFCILFSLCIYAWLEAAPYSHMEEVASPAAARFLAQKIIKQGTLSYCISIPEEKQKTAATADELALMLQSALREWTHGIALRIRQAGREKEFQDIISILEKPLSLQRLSSCDLTQHPLLAKTYPGINTAGQKADITLIFAPEYCAAFSGNINSFFVLNYKNAAPFICLSGGYANSLRPPKKGEYFPSLAPAASDAGAQKDRELVYHSPRFFEQMATGHYSRQQQQDFWRLNRLFEYDGHTFFDILVHELGHAFGLADEYVADRPRQFASLQPGQGLMKDGYEPISCDEIDGMITLLDRLQNKQRSFASFCSGRHRIVNGTEDTSEYKLPTERLKKILRTLKREQNAQKH